MILEITPAAVASDPANVANVANVPPGRLAPCATCRFWNELLPDSEGIFADGSYQVDDFGTGECRFNPPIGIRDPEAVALGEDSTTAAGAAMWPITYDGHWCGQHKPRLQEVGDDAP